MQLTITPLSDLLGARITGAGPSQLTEDDVARQVHDALLRHSVLVFPRLFISDDDLVALGHQLGQVVELPSGSLEGHPGIMVITRDPAVNPLAEMLTANDFWHTDGTSYERPDKATLLTARNAPDPGEGDTEFASTYAAYEALPDEEKERYAGLHVRHSIASIQRCVFPNPTDEQLARWSQVPIREHPLVWRRSDGRASLLIGQTAEAIVGMPEAESTALIAHLNEWATQPRFTVTHQWEEGDLVIFDNTALLHRSRPYQPTSPRRMHRTTLRGEEAVEAAG